MDPWCCDTYEEALVYFRDPGTILCGKCSDTEGINSIPVWGIPNINMRFKANRLHRVTEIILRFWGKFHLDSREISLRSSSYQDEVSGASRIYMEISSLYCLRCTINIAILINILSGLGYYHIHRVVSDCSGRDTYCCILFKCLTVASLSEHTWEFF